MSAKKSRVTTIIFILIGGIGSLLSVIALAATTPTESSLNNNTLARTTLAQQLGWVEDPNSECGGYYLDEPFFYSTDPEKANLIHTTGNQGMFSLRGTSVIEGKVTLNRQGQQLTANKAYLYRDPITGKINAIDLIGNVHLREPNTLIVAKKGRYNFQTNSKSLIDILYRTSINDKKSKNKKTQTNANDTSTDTLQHERKLTGLTAWGKAAEVSQTKPQIFELTKSSFTTCPPVNPAWRIKASHIELDKNTGRGVATHARILVKNVPVFYIPYINFSIDKQRKSGFLWPKIGASNQWGPYVLTPFYWNIAPNYDMTITPGILTKRGMQITDNMRYLTETSSGNIQISVLPNDKFFAAFQKKNRENPPVVENQSPDVTQAELNRLLGDSTTRKSLFWKNDSQYNANWSSHVDFSYAGDDYYMRNFGSLNEITQNQLLQEGDVYYKGPNWHFTGRVQAYQTLHPIDETAVQNQYRRFPQLILNGEYPDQKWGMTYFLKNEITNFTILKTPGSTTNLPEGGRVNVQPGVSLPLYWPYAYINPRVQFALTQYSLYQTSDTNAPTSKRRSLPIFDIAYGMNFNRDTILFNHGFQQTLEPQVYYTYIPYRNQSSIPVFDTTVNTLTYDQLFNYNRFSGLDRIGDANQMSLGAATRLIDQETGLEKVRLGVGDIIYFANRRVTLCNNASECTDNPSNHSNYQRFSPVSGTFDYHVNQSWKFTANAIWNPVSKQIDNSTLNLHYQPDEARIINLGYNFARNGNIYSGITTNDALNNLNVTDMSFAWPVINAFSAVGRWSQDWHDDHFQNLLYGIQYDTCCWAVSLVGGRAFTNLSENNTPQYNNEFYIQFNLKGLGNIDTGKSGLLSNISGYQT